MNIREAAQRGRCGDDMLLQRSYHHLLISVGHEARIYASLIIPQLSETPIASIEITPDTRISDERIGDDACEIALIHEGEYPLVDAWLRGYWETRA